MPGPSGVALAFLATWLASGCSGNLPRPPAGPTPHDALFEVPYPPPAARVESIPPQTDETTVWIDGQWDWDGDTYRWQPGAWAVPPRGAYFSRWVTERRANGRLYFAPAAWRGPGGQSLDLWPTFGAGCPKAAP